MRKLIVITSILLSFNALAASKKATITCDFKDKSRTVLDVDLKYKSAKQLNNVDYSEFPVIGDLTVVSHTSIYGDKLNSFKQISQTGSGEKVVWPAQLVLMGSNQDDSNFTLVIAYRFGECTQNGACMKPLVKATLISYWDGLDGGSETALTDKCSIVLN